MDGQVSVDEPCFFSQNVPVTLAYFNSYKNGKDFVIEWSTDSETGNAGFNIYYVTPFGLEPVNKNLIASKSVYSTVPLHYKYVTEDLGTDTFYLTDVDIFGKEIFHGPFKIDNPYGRKPEIDIIDWDSINSEHNKKKANKTLISRDKAIKKINSINNGKNLFVTSSALQQLTFPKAKISLVNSGR